MEQIKNKPEYTDSVVKKSVSFLIEHSQLSIALSSFNKLKKEQIKRLKNLELFVTEDKIVGVLEEGEDLILESSHSQKDKIIKIIAEIEKNPDKYIENLDENWQYLEQAFINSIYFIRESFSDEKFFQRQDQKQIAISYQTLYKTIKTKLAIFKNI